MSEDFDLLSVRTRNILKRAGIETLDALCGLTESDVLEQKNSGRTVLDELVLFAAKNRRLLRGPDASPEIPESIRDRFAMHAINALGPTLYKHFVRQVQELINGERVPNEADEASFPSMCASMAYSIADAMLIERTKASTP